MIDTTSVWGKVLSLLGGAVSVFCGNTPASQLAGGFKEGVAFAMKCCRHCETSKDDMQNIFDESQCVLRSEARLESQNERIDSFPALAQHCLPFTSSKKRKQLLSQLLKGVT